MITVKSLKKGFDKTLVLSDLNMKVEKGSIYGLVGPNGSGKTTLIKHLAGVYKEEAGEIRIDGEGVYENIALKQRIGYIQDDFYAFNQYTIENMATFYKGIYHKFNTEKFEKLGEIFNISKKRRIKTLSKGMKKQVAFWLTLSAEPDILILDEPLDGLDPIMRRNVLKLILNEVSKREMTTLVSSHNLRELEDICDSVGFMDKGRIVLEKKLDELRVNIHKVQLAFDHEEELTFSEQLKVVNKERVGKVYNVIIRGDKEKLEKEIKIKKPIIFDLLPLTLEEVFIYELGGEEIEANKFFN